MSELEDVKSKISNANNEIKKMKQDLSKYKKMNDVINNVVLAKLSSAKKSLRGSYDQIRKGYSSVTANKKVQELKNQIDETNIIINQLRGQILSEINRQIRLLESKIKSKEQTLNTLNVELSKLQKQY